MTNTESDRNNEDNRDSKISYNELKSLHNLSMTTLNNMSQIIPSLPSTSSSSSSTTLSSSTIFSSRNVPISKTNHNWIIPYHPYKESCHVCKYFGHPLKTCPNIKAEFRGGHCINCWETGHSSNDCNSDQNTPPFNEEFHSPEEIINFLIYNQV
jgi:hypothetical protein